MCFSLEADLVAGTVIGAIGVDAMAHARQPSTRAIAAVPLLLAGHQLVEAVVWSGLDDGAAGTAGRAATWLYLLVAFGIVPWLVPAVAAVIEPTDRRRLMQVCAGVGVVVAGVLFAAMVRGPVEAHIDGHRIAYVVPIAYGGAVVVAYVAAVTVALVASTHPEIRWFGIVNLFAAGALALLDARGFISLWCLLAAASSVVIAVHVRRAGDRAVEPPLRAGWSSRSIRHGRMRAGP